MSIRTDVKYIRTYMYALEERLRKQETLIQVLLQDSTKEGRNVPRCPACGGISVMGGEYSFHIRCLCCGLRTGEVSGNSDDDAKDADARASLKATWSRMKPYDTSPF